MPDFGWEFASWTGGGWGAELDPEDFQQTLTVSSEMGFDLTATALFLEQFDLSLAVDDANEGWVALNKAGNPETFLGGAGPYTLLDGDFLKLSAEAAQGHVFGGWSDDFKGADNSVYFFLEKDRTTAEIIKGQEIVVTPYPVYRQGRESSYARCDHGSRFGF